MRALSVLITCLFVALTTRFAMASELRMAVTTSFHNSGLSDVLLPEIEEDLGIGVHLIVVGTGHAIKLGRSGDVDAILVHSRTAEDKFIKDGFASHRREIMYNDFVIVGPGTDAAKVSSAKSVVGALKLIRKSQALFVSRGDDSGTHRREMELWHAAKIQPDQLSAVWYREVGAGMGAALNTASAMGAYILSDRASWLKFANKGDLKLLYSGDPSLFNQYAYLPVSPKKHRHVNAWAAERLETWLAGPKGQMLIGNYRLSGERLFMPNAK